MTARLPSRNLGMLTRLMDSDAAFQEFLDGISACFLEEDFQDWQTHVVLPLSLITEEGPVLLRNALELRLNFEHYLKACDAMSLDQVIRRPLSLEACADGTWIGTYETSLMSAGRRAVDPYVSSALLEWNDGQMRARSIMNARSHLAGVSANHTRIVM